MKNDKILMILTGAERHLNSADFKLYRLSDHLELNENNNHNKPLAFLSDEFWEKRLKEAFVGIVIWSYGSVLDAQNAAGAFSEGILKTLPEEQHNKLKEQFDEKKLGGDDLSDDERLVIFRTIIGIKVLQECFADDAAKWKLAVQKSKKLIQKKLALSKLKDVNALLAQFEISEYLF